MKRLSKKTSSYVINNNNITFKYLWLNGQTKGTHNAVDSLRRVNVLPVPSFGGAFCVFAVIIFKIC